MEWIIDPTNPGEVFACAGLAHLAWQRDISSVTGFVLGDRCTFNAAHEGSLLGLLSERSLVESNQGLVFCGITLDWWQEWGLNPELKTWAGQQTAFTVHRSLVGAGEGSDPLDWLAYSAPTTGRLNLDTLGTWNALEMGWSLNEHSGMQMQCRPWVELLATIGLQAFPVRGRKSDGGFHYHLWKPAAMPVAVAAFSGHGTGIYAIQGFHTPTAKAGSNTTLCRAETVP